MKYSFVVLLIISILSCRRDASEEAALNIQRHGNLTLVDSLLPGKHLELNNRPLPLTYYPVYYVGEQNDTIVLLKYGMPSESFPEVESLGDVDITCPDPIHTSIVVDTTMLLVANNLLFNMSDTLLAPRATKAYCAIIHSTSSSLVPIGVYGNLDLQKECKTPDGKWVSTELDGRLFCGNGMRFILLSEKRMAVTKFTVRQGKIKVEARLKLQQGNHAAVYSNSFTDYLDSIPSHSLTDDELRLWMASNSQK